MILPATRNLLVADGNSRTAGLGSTKTFNAYPIALRDLLNADGGALWTVLNKGIGGEAMDELAASYSTRIAPLFTIQPGYYARRVLVVCEAVNMLRDGHSAAQVAVSTAAYVTAAEATGWEVILLEEPPSPDDVDSVNALIGADVDQPTLVAHGEEGTDYDDATHLNDSGYAKWALHVEPFI